MTTFLPVNNHAHARPARADIPVDFQTGYIPAMERPPVILNNTRDRSDQIQPQPQPRSPPALNGEGNKRPATNGSTMEHGWPKENGSREGSSAQSSAPEDMPVHESDAEHYGSDHEHDHLEAAPPTKKKKGQRFFCTEYPPCNLSFTRSEHLARHIRKHTGERPFQCHCSRRFSRLDNLRQHAQTVHVNEDIPGDSLAATGTRFQRQIRTERVRQPGRARAGTVGSQSGHTRGHSRNLSTSSIASSVSNLGHTRDLRRPPPLMMAGDGAARARLSLETAGSPPRTPPQQMHAYPVQSPGGIPFTPSSATYDYSPFFQSPASASSYWGESPHNRRLSVPSGTRPFDIAHANSYPPTLRQIAPASGPYPDSPMGQTGPQTPLTPQGVPSSDPDWRRRTWHPSSNLARPPSGGSWFPSPVEPPPPQSGMLPDIQAASPPIRTLPPFSSFDKIRENPTAPPRREPSPMLVDTPGQQDQSAPPPPFPSTFNLQAPTSRPRPPISGPGHRRAYASLDMSLHRGLNNLDIGGTTSQAESGQWNQQIGTTNPEPAPFSSSSQNQNGTGSESWDHLKRHAWYNAPPVTAKGTAAQQQLPLPALDTTGLPTPQASVDYREGIVQTNGDVTPSQSSPQTHAAPASDNRLGRLEALVAVATHESHNESV